MRPRVLGRSIAVALVLAAALPAAAGAAGEPVVAVGADGSAHLAWSQVDGSYRVAQERRRSASGTLTDAQYVSAVGRDASQIRIAADPAGNAIIAWTGFDGTFLAVYSRRRAPDGALGPIRRISPPGTHGSASALAVDANGNAVFAWERDGGTSVHVRRQTAGGLLSTPQTLSAPGYSTGLRIGLDSAGNAVISWMRYVTEYEGTLQVRRRAADGTLGPTQTLGSPTSDAYDLAVARDGRAVLAWEWERETETLIRGRTRAANGTLGTTQIFSPTGATRAHSPSVAIDSTGRVLVTWSRFDANDSTSYVEGRARSAAGTLSGPFILGFGNSSLYPRVEVDANGNALFAWATDANDGTTKRRIQVRRRTPAGALSATQDISTPGADALEPTLGFDAGGAAVIAWTENASPGLPTVHARRRTALGALSPIAKLSE